jgi:hypothetical protein
VFGEGAETSCRKACSTRIICEKFWRANDREALWVVEKAFGKILRGAIPNGEKVVTEMAVYFRNTSAIRAG